MCILWVNGLQQAAGSKTPMHDLHQSTTLLTCKTASNLPVFMQYEGKHYLGGSTLQANLRPEFDQPDSNIQRPAVEEGFPTVDFWHLLRCNPVCASGSYLFTPATGHCNSWMPRYQQPADDPVHTQGQTISVGLLPTAAP